MAESASQSRELDVSPATKLVYKVLEWDGGWLSRAEIEEETMLAGRTVREGLKRLTERDVVEARPDPTRPRAMLYALTDGSRERP